MPVNRTPPKGGGESNHEQQSQQEQQQQHKTHQQAVLCSKVSNNNNQTTFLQSNQQLQLQEKSLQTQQKQPQQNQQIEKQQMQQEYHIKLQQSNHHQHNSPSKLIQNNTTIKTLVASLEAFVNEINQLMKLFKGVSNRLQNDNYMIVIKADKVPVGEHTRRINAPTTNEVAVVIVGEQFEKRDIKIMRKDKTWQIYL
ncbi:serum response factor homolog A-like [Teleopsis dalmanni]|uniref:serum response factor homolog A-like n=1 Tax=Teleopsis dalmanni TaxID=139649 RepID=UPI0018CE3F1A|nr:serum response factor homolog A-like [Teleopsis dalmanni]